MFSKNHLSILQEIGLKFPGTQGLADKVGLPTTVTRHLLTELAGAGFIRIIEFPNSAGDPEVGYADLLNPGKAAVDAPEHFLEKPMTTDKVHLQQKNNYFNGQMVGVIGSDNNDISDNQFTQVNNANTAELLLLVASLRQTALQFPKTIQDDLIDEVEDVEAEIQKPECDRNLRKLKKRLLTLATAGTLIAAPIAGMTDFANTAIDLATKLGIELQLPPSP